MIYYIPYTGGHHFFWWVTMILSYLFINAMFFLCYADVCTVIKTGTAVYTDCSSKGLRHVPNSIPNDTTKLDLSDNSLNVLRNFSFLKLPRIQSLKIRSSAISFIEQKAFFGLNKLDTLDLEGNNLDVTSFSVGVFEEIKILRQLLLSENKFEHYPEQMLQQLENLQTLSINGIANEPMGNGFKSLIKLQQLTFQPCDLYELRNETFMVFRNTSLKFISLSCKLRHIETGALVPLRKLDTLDIHWNENIRVSKLLPILFGLQNLNMTKIDFSSNNRKPGYVDILTASQFAMLGSVCVKAIDLSNNQIAFIRAGAILQMKNKNCLESLNIARNGLRGDFPLVAEMVLLTNLRYIDFSHQSTVYHDILRKRRIESKMYFTEHKNNWISKETLNKNAYKTTLIFRIPAKLEYLDASYISRADNNDLPNVTFTEASNLKYLDLSGNPFANCLGRFDGLYGLETFKMSKFICENLNLLMISSLFNLRHLECSSAHLSKGLQNDLDGLFLKNLTLLETIDLTGNGFKTLNPNMLQSQYHSVVSLKFSNNDFSAIPVSFEKFQKLETIDLVQNKITFLKEEEMKSLDEYQARTGIKLKLLLNSNRFVCNCDSLKFIKWLQETSIILDNDRNFTCHYIDKDLKSTIYAYENLDFLENKCLSKMWMIISTTLSLFMIVVCIGSCIAYRYRVTLQYWYLCTRRKYRHYIELDGYSSEYKYDAFISYCHADYEWVCGPLVNFLETEKSLSLCLHDRDFSPGKLIMDGIIDALSESKKVLIVISRDFLQSSWCEFELDMARMKMLQDNRDVLVVILLEQFTTAEMPDCLLQIWKKLTCLETDESIRNLDNVDFENLFWKRLHAALITQ